jgi:rare lipoprotein A (peptidoglycan hydrolase)
VRPYRLASIAIALAAGLAGCASAPRVSAPPPPLANPQRSAAPPPPTHLLEVPDAIPRLEPRSIYGNPPSYEVFGKRYYVMGSSVGYVERGVASWYGPGFHKELTSVREPYDMYGMTAAHKTLPLPAYVRVTNLQNGRSCVVRVNDRGPFVGNRIIDLSYTAAAKLDMLRDGTAMVEVRALQPLDPALDTRLTVASIGALPLASPPSTPAPASSPSVSPPVPLPSPPAVSPSLPLTTQPAAPSPAVPLTTQPVAAPAAASPSTPAVAAPAAGPLTAQPMATAAAAPPAIKPAPVTSAPVRTLFVQAGAFAAPENAQRLADKLRSEGYTQVFVRDDVIAGRKLYRVRIGPIPDVPQFDRIVAALEQEGVRDAHLALD